MLDAGRRRLAAYRRAQLSRLGAKGYGDAALQAKSRHKSRRSLEPYINLPAELAAMITAESDPNRCHG